MVVKEKKNIIKFYKRGYDILPAWLLASESGPRKAPCEFLQLPAYAPSGLLSAGAPAAGCRALGEGRFPFCALWILSRSMTLFNN